MTQPTSLAVDIGGTFTDVVLHRGKDVVVDKTLTTPDDLLEGFFRGIHAVLAKAGMKPAQVDGVLVHATTLVTNALIERRGAPTGIVFTAGFPDILELRDERRYDMYDPQIEFPRPLVERDGVFTVAERVLADGSVHRALDDADIEKLAADIRARGIKSIGVCLLHSYKNPVNEKRLAERLSTLLPSLYVSLSSEVAPQIREFFRASTTAANAYTVPITQPYLARLESRLAAEAMPIRPLIMLSSGGVVGPATAGRMPVRMIESGPAAGALGAAFIAKALDLRDLLAFDMGGTTAKVCLIQNGRPLVTGAFEIDRIARFQEGSGIPISVPCIDMIEIGAGGGSIAHVNDLGLLKVGPRSAGSKPGPSCYGLGGTDATVTDADVVLGIIDPNNFLGGDMRLDAQAAGRAMTQLAESLKTTPVAAARGIYHVVCEAMAGAVRAHATQRGVDYRGIPLLAFGGAGPVHACEVAQLINSRTVIFPPLASVLSAFGSLVTPMRLDLVRSSLTPLKAMNWPLVESLFDDMEAEGRKVLAEAGCPSDAIHFEYAADMRYRGQHYELLVTFAERPRQNGGPELLRRAYDDEYRSRYTLTQDDVDVEIVTWRIAALGPAVTAPDLGHVSVATTASVFRRVQAWQDEQDVAVLPRAALAQHGEMAGPLILEERETTLVIPPGWSASVGPLGCVIAKRDKDEA